MRKNLILFVLIIFLFSLIFACAKATKTEYNIDEKSCNSCGICIINCPADAIEFMENGKAVIDQTKCIQCGKCATVCPQKAVY